MALFTQEKKRAKRMIRDGLDTKARHVAELWQLGWNEVMAETEAGGRRYYYQGLGWTRASLPGRPPAIQTGAYARSVRTRRVSIESGWEVGTDSEIGPYLQFGTENMAARPHVVEGYERVKPEINREMAARID